MIKKVTRSIVNSIFLVFKPFIAAIIALIFTPFLVFYSESKSIVEEVKEKNGASRKLLEGKCWFWEI